MSSTQPRKDSAGGLCAPRKDPPLPLQREPLSENQGRSFLRSVTSLLYWEGVASFSSLWK